MQFEHTVIPNPAFVCSNSQRLAQNTQNLACLHHCGACRPIWAPLAPVVTCGVSCRLKSQPGAIETGEKTALLHRTFEIASNPTFGLATMLY